MFQRLDKLRKNAFASVILFGTNNSSSISGLWVLRGQELAFPVRGDYAFLGWGKDMGSTLPPGPVGIWVISRNVYRKELHVLRGPELG